MPTGRGASLGVRFVAAEKGVREFTHCRRLGDGSPTDNVLICTKCSALANYGIGSPDSFISLFRVI
jgi:hypothetical protein